MSSPKSATFSKEYGVSIKDYHNTPSTWEARVWFDLNNSAKSLEHRTIVEESLFAALLPIEEGQGLTIWVEVLGKPMSVLVSIDGVLRLVGPVKPGRSYQIQEVWVKDKNGRVWKAGMTFAKVPDTVDLTGQTLPHHSIPREIRVLFFPAGSLTKAPAADRSAFIDFFRDHTWTSVPTAMVNQQNSNTQRHFIRLNQLQMPIDQHEVMRDPLYHTAFSRANVTPLAHFVIPYRDEVTAAKMRREGFRLPELGSHYPFTT